MLRKTNGSRGRPASVETWGSASKMLMMRWEMKVLVPLGYLEGKLDGHFQIANAIAMQAKASDELNQDSTNQDSEREKHHKISSLDS